MQNILGTAARVSLAAIIVSAALPAAAFDLKKSDTRLSGAELTELVVGKHLHYIYSKRLKQKGVETYAKGGRYTVEFNAAGKIQDWGGTYKITSDGQICKVRTGGNKVCELYVMAGGKLTKINTMGERYTATIR